MFAHFYFMDSLVTVYLGTSDDLPNGTRAAVNFVMKTQAKQNLSMVLPKEIRLFRFSYGLWMVLICVNVVCLMRKLSAGHISSALWHIPPSFGPVPVCCKLSPPKQDNICSSETAVTKVTYVC